MEAEICISVIVPVYKVESYLPKCVDSLRNQTYPNLEIILVDDGSPDGCGSLCDGYEREDNRIRVIHKRNGGLSSARNAGLDVATGEYFAFVDSDDWLEPDALESMLNAALTHNVPLVCAGRYDVDGVTGAREKGLCPPRLEVISGTDLVRRIFRWQNMDSAAWDKLYHRSLFRSIRYPLGKIVEDVPTTYRIALDAGQAVLLPKPVYNYLHREDSITTATVSEKTFHFSQHTQRVYDDITANHPELEPEARYLRVRSLLYNVLAVELAGEEAKDIYADVYQESRRELHQHIGFILCSPFFTKGEKLKDILAIYGLYFKVLAIYQKLKRTK